MRWWLIYSANDKHPQPLSWGPPSIYLNHIYSNNWAPWENLFIPHANKAQMSLCEQGTDEPVHPHNLISASVVHCLDTCRISPTFAKPEISRLRLGFVAEQAYLSLKWLHTSDKRFSHDVTQIISGIVISCIFMVPCLLTLDVPARLSGKFHPRYFPVKFAGIFRPGKYAQSGKYGKYGKYDFGLVIM